MIVWLLNPQSVAVILQSVLWTCIAISRVKLALEHEHFPPVFTVFDKLYDIWEFPVTGLREVYQCPSSLMLFRNNKICFGF